jgi:hypothetical protein
VFRSPANLASNLAAIGRLSRGPIVIPGDLLQGGRKYATRVHRRDRRRRRGERDLLRVLRRAADRFPAVHRRELPNWSFEVSPESHDKIVRHAMEGQAGYENEAMEHMLREALKLNCHRIDVFYMIGLPKQTYQSVMETVDYCEYLFSWGDPRLQCFISPMGPFLDPGSQIFEEPERFGYRKLAHTLEEHRQLLTQPSWEHILNYETEWMTRAQLVDATYDAAERLNELKLRYGRITAKQARAVADGIAEARRLRARRERRRAGRDGSGRCRAAARRDRPLQPQHRVRQARAVLAAPHAELQAVRDHEGGGQALRELSGILGFAANLPAHRGPPSNRPSRRQREPAPPLPAVGRGARRQLAVHGPLRRPRAGAQHDHLAVLAGGRGGGPRRARVVRAGPPGHPDHRLGACSGT